MDPITILALISGAQQLVKLLVPEVQKLLASGNVSAADQAKLKAAIDSIRDGSAFSTDPWQP